jgi:hypothetical protein
MASTKAVSKADVGICTRDKYLAVPTGKCQSPELDEPLLLTPLAVLVLCCVACLVKRKSQEKKKRQGCLIVDGHILPPPLHVFIAKETATRTATLTHPNVA